MVAPGGSTSQQSTGAIVRIADPASLAVEADINESDIARLQLGQPATIRVDAVPDRTYRGHLRQIVPTADRQRAVVEVKVAVDDRDDRLVPDMSCTVNFLEEGAEEAIAEAEPGLAVPLAAAVEQEGQTFVFIVRGQRAERRDVELGDRVGDGVEVRQGLGVGDEVVLSPAELTDGDRVRIAPSGG